MATEDRHAPHSNVRVPRELFDAISEIAAAQERSGAWMITRILRDWLATQKGTSVAQEDTPGQTAHDPAVGGAGAQKKARKRK
jgi:hypothetical protein